jgi:hypothetical protein
MSGKVHDEEAVAVPEDLARALQDRPEAERLALLRWVKPGCGGPFRPCRYQITRASSANASARRAVGRTSVPRS